MQLRITNIPRNADERDFRKQIARQLFHLCNKRRVKFKVRLWRGKGAGRGELIVEDDEGLIQDLLINRRVPVVFKKSQLGFEVDRLVDEEQKYWKLEQVRAMQGDELASDYEETEDKEEKASSRLFIRQVSCGAWDGEGRYVDAWRSKCEQNAQVRIEEDGGRLFIRCPQGTIRINIYDIKYTILDRHKTHLYFVLRSLPTFLTESKSSGTDKGDPRRQCNLGKEHANCAPYSYVYRVHYISSVNGFLAYHARRLIAPDQLSISPSNIAILTTKALDASLDLFYRSLHFDTAFQVQALITSWQVLPVEINALQESFRRLGEATGAARVKLLSSEIAWRDPRPSMNKRISILDIQRLLLLDPLQQGIDDQEFVADSAERRVRLAFFSKHQEKRVSDAVFVHCLAITPAGLQLSGPVQDAGNRILRMYPGLDNQYLRVSFKDEMGEQIREEQGIDSQTDILFGKFRAALDNGIVIAGVRFEFLAFSNSQLRSHGCWFVRAPLIVDGSRVVNAEDIRNSIGNLSSIRCPARFAARLGQAFTTTLYSIKVPRSEIAVVDDIKSNCGKYEFSDGVGRISPDMVALLNKAGKKSTRSSKKAASVFQIRLDGAKGVLALDTRMMGRRIDLRPSMVKFQSSDSEMDLAVAKPCTEALPFYLNGPLISLLESLGVPYRSFLHLQEQALHRIEAAAKDSRAAGNLLCDYGLGSSTRTTSTLASLEREFGIDALREIPFFRDVVQTAVSHSLRVTKYKARIRVPGAHTLMGIMDETGALAESEVYACLQDASGQRTALSGSCLVLRSPAMHPGDVQLATAIGEVSSTSPLHALTNCLVFSQRGARPLPSMLAGGDLDGDLYNVVQNSRLFPENTYFAAEYPRIRPADIDRRVRKTDIIDFFLNYIISNKVGMIANRHAVISDQSPDGALNPRCILLSGMYSVALDYPKTGVQVNLLELPRASGRPDFMEDEYRVEERAEGAYRKLKLHARPGNGFYKSSKALGKLFRNIQVSALITRWGLGDVDDGAPKLGRWSAVLLSRLRPPMDGWMRYLPYHRLLVKFYFQEERSLAIGYHTEGRTDALKSAEVFLGCILLRGPYRTANGVYDLKESLRTDFRDLVHRFLDAAACPSEEEDVGMREMERFLRMLRAADDGDDYMLDASDGDDDRTVGPASQGSHQGRAFSDFGDVSDDDADDSDTQASFHTLEASTLADQRMAHNQWAEEQRANHLYLSLYSLFYAALQAQEQDSSQCTCPWVVFPRLLAAKKNYERLCVDEMEM